MSAEDQILKKQLKMRNYLLKKKFYFIQFLTFFLHKFPYYKYKLRRTYSYPLACFFFWYSFCLPCHTFIWYLQLFQWIGCLISRQIYTLFSHKNLFNKGHLWSKVKNILVIIFKSSPSFSPPSSERLVLKIP